jgi:hypothetical protein
VGHEVVVLHRGEVARPLDVAADELPDSGLVERPLAAREDARVIDQVIDDGVGVRPIGLGRGDEATELRRRRRQVAVARGCGGGADQREGEHPVGGVERNLLGDPPTRRDADQVRGRDTEAIEHAGGVSREVRPRVLRLAGLIGD